VANAAVPARNVAERAGGHEEDTASATEVKGEGHALSEAEAECADAIGVLAPRLRDGHDFQQVAIRVLEVEAPPASTAVALAVGMGGWLAAVGGPLSCTQLTIASNSASLKNRGSASLKPIVRLRRIARYELTVLHPA
jgi:hypothetical protein